MVPRPFLLLFQTLLLFILLFSQCSSTQQSTVSSPENNEVDAPQHKSTNKTTVSKDTSTTTNKYQVKIDSSHISTFPMPDADSLFASLRRTSCYGTCPIYKLRIYKGGFVLYKGKKFNRQKTYPETGWYRTTLSQRNIEAIQDSAQQIGFFDLNDRYDAQIADVAATITFLKWDGRQKEIYHQMKGPDRLTDFEKYIDNLLYRKTWTPVKILSEN